MPEAANGGQPQGEGGILTVGVVSDTHIPDRVGGLHPGLIPALREARVGAILHGGDISVPRVLHALEEIAPVTAVRGNRDWAFAGQLPWEQRLEFSGVPVALVHGHGTWARYLWDKLQYITAGYDLNRYQKTWRRLTNARVIVFGHTHRAENHWKDGQLWFNPGSACSRSYPSFGLLHFSAGQVVGEIVRLDADQWVGQEQTKID